jgi:hypothetical protein
MIRLTHSLALLPNPRSMPYCTGRGECASAGWEGVMTGNNVTTILICAMFIPLVCSRRRSYRGVRVNYIRL